MLPLATNLSRYDDGHGIELEPHRNRGEQSPEMSLRAVMRLVRMGKKPSAQPTKPTKSYLQRCAVQVRYTKGGSVGKWYSHGSYIARETQKGLGYSADSQTVPVAETVASWRKDGDGLFFRVILSPEFADRLDLEKHTYEVVEDMEYDLGTKLQWVAVIHRNTDNPHVHLVLRGVREDGSELRIPRDYIQEGLRNRAQERATNQLGFRTEQDIVFTQKREIEQYRFTSLDRLLKQRAEPEAEFFKISVHPEDRNLQGLQLATEHYLERRLHALERMGLAQPEHGGEWRIDPDFEKSLRTVQKTQDRLKIMAEHGVLASDPHLPFRVLRPSQVEEIEGRVLVHGQDEYSGNNFTLLESVEGELVRLSQNREMAQARQRGELQPGHYLRMEKLESEEEGGRASYYVEDCGEAQELLRDPLFFRVHASRLAEKVQHRFGGWLGEMRHQVNRENGRTERVSARSR